MPKRKVRLPTTSESGLPATFAEAEEQEIIGKLEQWYPRLADKLNSEAGHEAVREHIYSQLERGAGASLPLAYIVAMADAGHPPADHALRFLIHGAMDAKRFNDLPLQVQAYAQRSMTRAPLSPIYASNQPQVVNDYSRDMVIPCLVDEIVRRWPQVPLLYSNQTRHSAAWLVALVFSRHGIKLTERQVCRIYNRRQTIHQRLAEFLIADLPFE